MSLFTFEVYIRVGPEDPGLGHDVDGVVGGGEDEAVDPADVGPLPLQRLQVGRQQRGVLGGGGLSNFILALCKHAENLTKSFILSGISTLRWRILHQPFMHTLTPFGVRQVAGKRYEINIDKKVTRFSYV